MRIYSGLKDVIDDIDQLTWEGTFFTNKEVWKMSPEKAKFIYLAGNDELDDIDDEDEKTMLPRLAKENDASYFLDFQLFEDVIITQRKLNQKSTSNDFVHALNYYREYDTFYWPTK